MVQIDRSTPPEIIRAFRMRIGRSQEALSADLGLGENAVYRYERYGAPKWMRFALVGLTISNHGLTAEEASRLAQHGSTDLLSARGAESSRTRTDAEPPQALCDGCDQVG